MAEAVPGIASVTVAAAPPPPEPRSAADWAKEAMSWASPDGLVLRAVQPIAAEALRRSEVGQGTEWGRGLQRVLDDPRSVPSFQQGFREGVWNGAKGLVEGAWSLAKTVGAHAYDKNLLGEGLDLLRGQGVAVPDWAPSADRADAKMQAVGEEIGRYLSEVGRNPGKLGDDVKGWIGANWDALKADHAAAAAKGGAAEAEWWGQIAGRATFEVAAVAVPVTKFATVAKAGEALNLALKAGKLGETLADAARAGKLFELWGAAVKAGKVPELVAEARQARRLGELVAEARKASGGLETLAGKGGLTADEIGALEKAGTLSSREAAELSVAAAGAGGRPVVVDLFGGRTSQLPGAINVDVVAESGIRASATELPFKTGSIDRVVASNPFIPGSGSQGMMAFLPEAARVTKPGGQIIINSTARNPFGNLPDAAALDRLGLRVVVDRGPLGEQFNGNVFRFTDGRVIPNSAVQTTILQKVP